VLSALVELAGADAQPDYEKIKEITDFTEEEYAAFIRKAIDVKQKTDNKITRILNHNSNGISHMSTHFKGELNYVVYASKSPNFSIQQASKIAEQVTLKKYIEAYKHILISVGSHFSYRGNGASGGTSFHNRGISRNPYWVFRGKHSGLSMILQGFSGAVAARFFPEKKVMLVQPIGSMQYIIKKNLLPGEGYIEKNGERVDLTKVEVSVSDLEGSMNYIKLSALARIYNQAVKISPYSKQTLEESLAILGEMAHAEYRQQPKMVEELAEKLHPDFKQHLEQLSFKVGMSFSCSAAVILCVQTAVCLETLLNAVYGEDNDRVSQLLKQLIWINSQNTKIYELLWEICGNPIVDRWGEYAFHNQEGCSASLFQKEQAIMAFKKKLNGTLERNPAPSGAG